MPAFRRGLINRRSLLPYDLITPMTADYSPIEILGNHFFELPGLNCL
jgi:hypothetical protein